MTNTTISEAAKKRACELAMSEGVAYTWVPEDMDFPVAGPLRALARQIQTTSDVAWRADQHLADKGYDEKQFVRLELQSLILPEPKDPLEDVLADIVPIIQPREGETPAAAVARLLREKLPKHGLQITPIEVTPTEKSKVTGSLTGCACCDPECITNGCRIKRGGKITFEG